MVAWARPDKQARWSVSLWNSGFLTHLQSLQEYKCHGAMSAETNLRGAFSGFSCRVYV